LDHHVLIKLIVSDSMSRLSLHVSWYSFIDMDREAFISTQIAQTYSYSLREREVEE